MTTAEQNLHKNLSTLSTAIPQPHDIPVPPITTLVQKEPAVQFIPFLYRQSYNIEPLRGYSKWRQELESHPRTQLFDAILGIPSSPMFAGMRGVHGQMLSSGNLGGPPIPGLGGFGLSSSLPSLPPDRKVYSTPPQTPLPTLPSPSSITPTSASSTTAYYDHMKY